MTTRYRLTADGPALSASELVTTVGLEQQIADAIGAPAWAVNVDELDLTPDRLLVTVHIYVPAAES